MKTFRLFTFRNFRLELTLRQYPTEITPYEAGAADAYYGRRNLLPHRADFWGRDRTDLTEAEKVEYRRGLAEEEDRKDWG